MRTEWDSTKARANFRKHGIRFADAVSALEDERAVSIQEDHDGEERWVTIGTDSLGRVLLVVDTWRDDAIRVISADRQLPLRSNNI